MCYAVLSLQYCTGETIVCEARTQVIPTHELYQQMLQSPEYSRWQAENTPAGRVKLSTIGETVFCRARCGCIVDGKQQDCANETIVAMLHLQQALQVHRHRHREELENCLCEDHRTRPGYNDIHKGITRLLNYLQCDKTEYAGVCRPCFPSQRTTRPTPSVPLRHRNGRVVVKPLPAPTITGNLHLHQRKCAFQNCSECGVRRRLLLKCPIDNDPSAIVKVRVFMNRERPAKPKKSVEGGTVGGFDAEELDDGDDADEDRVQRGASGGKKKAAGRKQKELTEVDMNMMDVMKRFEAAAKMLVPYQWSRIWDLHNRQLFFETFDAFTLVICTDFAANFACTPQYRLTSAQDAHAIQGVRILH